MMQSSVSDASMSNPPSIFTRTIHVLIIRGLRRLRREKCGEKDSNLCKH